MIPLFKPYMPEKLPKLDYILHSVLWRMASGDMNLKRD